MIEYEYSFRVDSIDNIIDYCISNGYKLLESNYQERKLYTNSNRVLARITKNVINSKESIVLDFKDENNSDFIYKESRESIPLKVGKNIKSINSILEILDYKLSKVLERHRTVYAKDGIKFEIDSYTSPEIAFVVAIEGNKSLVESIYKEVSEL